MHSLWLYGRLSRALPLSYRNKIMLVAFAGTHIPLLALIGFFVAWTAPSLQVALATLAVALIATLVGTAVTLFVLNHLIRPILLTSSTLRRYAAEGGPPDLPTQYDDDAGTLMADASHALNKLDRLVGELTYYDAVTGLPNRDRLLQELGRRMLSDTHFALLVIDFGNLARIVSTFGQGAADSASRLLTRRLEVLTDRDAANARIDTQLFATVLGGAGTEADLAETARSLLAGLGPELVFGELRLLPELTAGIAVHSGDDRRPESLLNDAIAALAAAKREPDRQFRFFSPNVRDAARHLFTLEQELRRALDREEFVLNYQPVVDLRLGRAVGAEALIRWRHPDRGMVSPGEFIPVAETSGLIEPMGRWVLEEVCRQIRAWSADPSLADLRIAVNLSARQFRDPTIVARIADALSLNAVAPSQLEIELTETATMSDHERTRRVFSQIREMGARVAIDDFGTGYSSMSYLRTLPFDKLKIDREFVAGVDQSRKGQAICKALIELSHGLEIDVLAEGTETPAEVRQLRELGCRLFQGFYFARPVSAEMLPQEIGLKLTGSLMESMAA